MIIVIDNYDSFVYNLVQYLGELINASGKDIQVFRNDKITIGEIRKLKPDFIVISPGPCTPKEAGIAVNVIKEFAGKVPILGVCLGHQCIVEAFGGKIVRAKKLMHGKTSMIYHDGKTIYKGITNPFEATRYHSLIAEKLPEPLELTAWTVSAGQDKEIMGTRLKHTTSPVEGPVLSVVEGVRFHPESILTKQGMKILKNFIEGNKKWKKLS